RWPGPHAPVLGERGGELDRASMARAAGRRDRRPAPADRPHRLAAAGPRPVQLAAARAARMVAGGRRGAGLKARIRRVMARPLPEQVPLPEDLPPLLRRIYAARRVRDAAELAPTLSALLPVGSLEHVGEAAALLLSHRHGRVLVVGDFDADGAT